MRRKSFISGLTDDEIKAAFVSAANKLLTNKASVIEDAKEMLALVFNTSELEKKQDELLEETQLISDMAQAAIRENATTALNQTEYQKRYDSLTIKFDTAKDNLEKVMAELEERKHNKARIEDFIKQFEQTSDTLTEFNLDAWNSLVDYATVYSNDDIRFTFKNGQEIQA